MNCCMRWGKDWDLNDGLRLGVFRKYLGGLVFCGFDIT